MRPGGKRMPLVPSRRGKKRTKCYLHHLSPWEGGGAANPGYHFQACEEQEGDWE